MINYKGKNKRTVNQLKVMYFDYPDWVPAGVGIMPATWMKHRDKIEEIVLAHPRMFPGYVKGSTDYDNIPLPETYKLGKHTDAWGCIWDNLVLGLEGHVAVHPLTDWSTFDQMKWPDPMKDDAFGPMPDWDNLKKWFDDEKKKGNLATGGGLQHGFMYMKLYYIRGFDNFMIDLAMDDPMLHKLIDKLVEYNVAVVKKHLDLGAEHIALGEDLGLQKSLPMSPEMWRKFIKPCYEKIFGQCRDRNIPVFLHSDGNILEIVKDLKEVGVTTLNPQFRANGLDNIVKIMKGNIALHQDLDRQRFPFSTPKQLDEHITETFNALFNEKGGLSFYAEISPDIPLVNVDAICTTLEKLCNLPGPDVV
jgi:uroporphyrinogen decarboxylase